LGFGAFEVSKTMIALLATYTKSTHVVSKGHRGFPIETNKKRQRHLTKGMASKIDSEKGRRIHHCRIAIAEPVFANIRTFKAM